MKIVIDIDIPYIGGILEPFAEVIYRKGSEISQNDVAGADILVVRTRTKCDRNLLEGTKVRMIATATIGYDHIDIEYCAKKSIKVATAAGCNARGVLQWMGAALAYLSSRQEWTPQEKTIGVVGIGHVGSLVAEYANIWGFKVLCCDPPRKKAEGTKGPAADFVELADIAINADIVTLHTPLTFDGTDATHHLIAHDFLASVKERATLINTSRGEVVNTEALIKAIDSKKISACIDTWENEPNISRGLLEKTLISTPHIAGYTAQGKANASSMVINAIAKEYGLPINRWYPSGVNLVEPSHISWEGLKKSITGYFDIETQSMALKAAPGNFENFRNSYSYREEYF